MPRSWRRSGNRPPPSPRTSPTDAAKTGRDPPEILLHAELQAKPTILRGALKAWIGLVPRQRSCGGHERLGGISKIGYAHLRRLLIAQLCIRVRLLTRTGRCEAGGTTGWPQADCWSRKTVERGVRYDGGGGERALALSRQAPRSRTVWCCRSRICSAGAPWCPASELPDHGYGPGWVRRSLSPRSDLRRMRLRRRTRICGFAARRMARRWTTASG